jgi:hypothetical protein
VRPAVTQENITDGTTIAFGTETFDQGNNFASNTFTAPVAGKYHFDVIVRADNITASGTYKRVKLVMSNATVSVEVMMDPEAWDQTSAFYCFTYSGLVHLDPNDTVFLQWSQGGGDATQDIDGGSYFSGHLVC